MHIWINAPTVVGQNPNSTVVLGGNAYLSDGNQISYSLEVPWDEADVDQLVVDAAVTAALALEYDVGPTDRKVLLGRALVL